MHADHESELKLNWVVMTNPVIEDLDEDPVIMRALKTFGFTDDGDVWVPLVYAKAHGLGIEIRVRAGMEEEACVVWQNGAEYVRGEWLLKQCENATSMCRMLGRLQDAWWEMKARAA